MVVGMRVSFFFFLRWQPGWIRGNCQLEMEGLLDNVVACNIRETKRVARSYQ